MQFDKTMDKKLEKTLEFDKIKENLANFATTLDAKDKCLNLHFYNKLSDVNKEINETLAAFNCINQYKNLTFDKITNISESLKRLEIKSTLNLSEIMNISRMLNLSFNIVEYFKNTNIENNLYEYYNKLNPLTKENAYIKSIVISEEEIYDNATDELSSIRKKKKILNEKINIVANRLLNKYESYLQDPIITTRNGSLCFPVKSEYKNKIDGITLDVSSSEFTIFIEPKELIEIKNNIIELESKEKIETNKILKQISDVLSDYTQILKTNYDNIIKLDFIFAKAEFANYNNLSLPIINDKQNIKLIDARHPLLPKDKCVPLNLEIGSDYKSLIITGPNTGGKTVCLKTVGLIELMALSGLFIPAKENSTVSTFDNIFLDIGDEQSIEQSLSTFSGHMKNIVNIINNSTDKSLCLFDELCSGTDPIEGANLAIAIIKFLMNKNSTTFITTHYPELKLFALSNEKVINGSFEFDVNTLMPTYKLILGIPGKSNAFIISEKLGLNKTIIEEAKNMLSQNDIKFEEIVSELEASKLNIEREKKLVSELKKEASDLREKVKRQQAGLDNRTESVINKAKIEARNILLDAKNKADTVLKDLNKNNKDIISNDKNELNKMISNINSDLVEKVKGPKQPLSPKKINIGDSVKVLSFNSNAQVESLPDKDYNLFVRIGNIRVKVNLKELEAIDSTIDKKNTTVKSKVTGTTEIKKDKTISISPEINLIGKTTDEAYILLDKYLDDAYLSHLPYCRIIHGRGTGALKNMVQNFLRKSKIVKEYRYGEYTEGGDGATVVTFI